MRGALFLLLSAAFLLTGALYRAPFFLAVGIAGLAVWGWMLFLALLRRKGARVFFSEEEIAAEAGERISLPVVSERRGEPLPAGTVVLESRLRGKSEKMRVKTGDETPGALFSRPGLFRLHIAGARLSDPMGLFRLPFPRDGEGKKELFVTVLPALRGGEETLPADAVTSKTGRAAGRSGEREEILPYRPGDPARKIHWKLSARFDELLVRRERERELPVYDLSPADCRPSFEEDPDGFYGDLRQKIENALSSGYAVRFSSADGEKLFVTDAPETLALFRRLYEKEENGEEIRDR